MTPASVVADVEEATVRAALIKDAQALIKRLI